MSRVAIIVALLAGLFFALDASPASAAVVYMGPFEANTTLRQAFSVVKGGDTLIIRDGTYPERFTSPPSGSSGQYTVVRAEHVGGVVFDPSGLDVYSNLTLWNVSYIEIEGITFRGSYVPPDVTPSLIAGVPRRFSRSF